MVIESPKLSEFIKSVREDIENTKQDGSFELVTPIDFEVSVAITKQGGGKLDIIVAEAGGKYEKESIAKIRFSMGNPLSLDQLLKLVEIWHISSKTTNETFEIFYKNFKNKI